MLVSRRLLLLSGPLAAVALGAAKAGAQGAGPAATIQGFYDALIAVMKTAKSQSFDQRSRRLQPVISRVFDLPLMTRIAVGPEWPQLRPDQQQRLTTAFALYTVSTYASRFDGYSGERFEVDPNPSSNASGVVVQSRLIRPDGGPVTLNYLMRQVGGGWQVIDVFLSGTVSELATRRSEFAAVLRRGGADGLVRMLDQRAAALRAG